MKNKILTTSLALALGLTILAPTAKADELDDLLNGATAIEDDLNQNTGDLDKLKKEKVVIPAKEIEDIAKPNKKEDKPSSKPSVPSSNKNNKKDDEKNKDNKDDKNKPSSTTSSSEEGKKEDNKEKDNKKDDKTKVDEEKKKTEAKEDNKKKEEKIVTKKAENKTNTNVKTGVGSVSAIVGLLSASLGGLFYSKKNK